MTILKADAIRTERLMLYGSTSTSGPVTWRKVEAILAARTKPLEASGVAALRAAYDEAKRVAGRNPTLQEMNALVRRAKSSITNERAAGRINDGFVDNKEGAALKGPVAPAVFEFLSTVYPANTRATASVKATTRQLERAAKSLSKVIDDGFARFGRVQGGEYADLVKAMRQAATAAGLPESGRSAVLIATNGKTGRGDNGQMNGGGASLPTSDDVKSAIQNALTKLKGADGAAIVDFAHPNRQPTSEKDQVVTDLEAIRTPSVTGKTALEFLKYASGL